MKNSRFYTLLREPLLHFLLIGSVLFFAYNLRNENLVENNRIVISEAKIDRLITLWEKQRQRLPTQGELRGLIEQQVRQEVMYREALAMGLDKDDSVVRRRLAQKVEFISADLAALAEPDEAELADYLATNRNAFELPARISFVQIFIDPNKYGDKVHNHTNNLLNKLKQTSSDLDISTIGDSLMLNQQHDQLTEHDISRLFGSGFAKKLLVLPVGDWQGPIISGYGLHLVRIDDKTEAHLPKLETVKEKVRVEWLAQQRRIINEALYKGLRQRYEIVIKYILEKDSTASTKQ